MPDETPRRRAADRDRRRWTDHRLDDLADEVRALGPVGGQVIRAEARLAGLVEEVDNFKGWIGDVETRLRADLNREREDRQAAEQRQKEYTERVERACGALGTRLDAGLTARLSFRAMIAVGALAAAATIIAALIAQ